MPTVSNTSPISNLANIGRLDLVLEQFSTLWIPSAVRHELLNIPDTSVRTVVETALQAGWMRGQPAKNTALISLLTVELDQGEAEALALALELEAERILIDERDGRLMARQLGLPVIGVLGVLLRAKRLGRLKTLKEEIAAPRKRAGFFIASELEREVLRSAGE